MDLIKKEKITIKNLSKVNTEIVSKCLSYLENLSKNLKHINYELLDGFAISPDKSNYFDIVSKEHRLYDFREFNIILAKTYQEEIIEPKLNLNSLFWKMKHCIDIIYSKSNYKFYNDLFNTYHLLSWFFRSLRRNALYLEANSIILDIPMIFLEKKAGIQQNREFIIEFINLLKERNIISIENLVLKFNASDFKALEDLINFSFESLVFGGNLNIDQIQIISEDIDNSVLINELISEDYKFNYIVAKTTNYISYDYCSNNLLID